MIDRELSPEFQLLLIRGMSPAEDVQGLLERQVVWVGDDVEVVGVKSWIIVWIQLRIVPAQSPFSRSSASALAMQLADVHAVTDSNE